MDLKIADLAVALHKGVDEDRRAAFEALALSMLLLDLVRRELALIRVHLCALRLDERVAGGEDDERDGAAA